MLIYNKTASLAYRLVLLLVCFFGLLVNSGASGGGFAPYVLLYYSIACNILCFVFYAINAAVIAVKIKGAGRHGIVRFAPHFKGGLVMCMLLAMVVYIFVLLYSPFANGGRLAFASNIIVHFIVPGMVLVDWALFSRKGRLHRSDPIIWLVIPFAYYCMVLVAAQLGIAYYGGVAYPYRFINPDIIGWPIVLVNILVLSLLYLGFSFVLFAIDKTLAKRKKKRLLAANKSYSFYKHGTGIRHRASMAQGAQASLTDESFIDAAAIGTAFVAAAAKAAGDTLPAMQAPGQPGTRGQGFAHGTAQVTASTGQPGTHGQGFARGTAQVTASPGQPGTRGQGFARGTAQVTASTGQPRQLCAQPPIQPPGSP